MTGFSKPDKAVSASLAVQVDAPTPGPIARSCQRCSGKAHARGRGNASRGHDHRGRDGRSRQRGATSNKVWPLRPRRACCSGRGLGPKRPRAAERVALIVYVRNVASTTATPSVTTSLITYSVVDAFAESVTAFAVPVRIEIDQLDRDRLREETSARGLHNGSGASSDDRARQRPLGPARANSTGGASARSGAAHPSPPGAGRKSSRRPKRRKGAPSLSRRSAFLNPE